MPKNPKSGLDVLSSATRLSKQELRDIFAEVQQNHRILAACTRHQFEGRAVRSLGEKHTCLNCGGVMPGERIAVYAEGVRHAGTPFEVWID